MEELVAHCDGNLHTSDTSGTSDTNDTIDTSDTSDTSDGCSISVPRAGRAKDAFIVRR